MNATVARIVELLFEDAVMNDETVAFKDEVMNNCQERYDDLRSCGMSEDDAIAAVVESLKGMEKVIAQYPHKEVEHPNQPDEEGQDNKVETDLVFNPEIIRHVKTLLTSENLNFEASSDELIHVYYNKSKMPYLIVENHDDTLNIKRDNDMAKEFERAFSGENGRVDINSFAGFMKGMRKVLNRVQCVCSFQSQDITVALPNQYVMDLGCCATSGDICADGINADSLTLTSTSGNVEVLLGDGMKAKRIQINTTSGDMTIHANALAAELRAVSGDVEYEGHCPDLLVSTVSGDSSVNAKLNQVKMVSVSGDMELYVEDDDLRTVDANTTSGDLNIRLPMELRGCVEVHMKSVSGDCHNAYGSCNGAPVAYVNMKSVSGDLSIE